MQILSRKPPLAVFALVTALSAPFAIAQSAAATAEATPAAAIAQTQTNTRSNAATTETKETTETSIATQPGAASTAATTAPSASTTAPAKKSWADVDADKNGKVTKAEAESVPALSKVFDQADGNADGTLTAEEYKAYAAQLQGGNQGADGSK